MFKKITTLLIIGLCIWTGKALASPLPSRLPVPIPDRHWRPLYNSVEPVFQRDLERELKRNNLWNSLIRKKRMAVGLVDISAPGLPRFARVNGGAMMYAASLPKIAILLAAFVSFEDGSLEETPEIHQELTNMIRTSSNSAATRMIDRLGFDKIGSVLRDPRYQFYDEHKGGGLWVGKRYAKAGKRLPDPLMGLSHAATATQVCRFYYFLATGRIINPKRSGEMLQILSDPGLHHKFVNVLEKCVPPSRLFRKSGTWKQWHADSVLVWGKDWRRYILASIVDSPKGERILRDLVPVVERILRSLHHL